MSDISAPRRSFGKVTGGLCVCGGLLPAILAAGIALRTADGPEILGILVLGWIAASALVLGTLGAHPHSRFGPANALTAARAACVLVLAALAFDRAPALPDPRLAAAGLAILLLDGLDGMLARRSGLASAYGARFDMEVDAGLTLALSILVWRGGAAGPEVLLLIAPYYLFSLLRPALPWLGAPLGPSRWRKAVCVAQVATPIALLALPVPETAARVLVLGVLGAIAASFLRDILDLRAQER